MFVVVSSFQLDFFFFFKLYTSPSLNLCLDVFIEIILFN